MPTKRKPRRQRKPAAPDWSAVALEVEPVHAGRRQVLESLLVGASAEVDRLVALGDELTAAHSRALTEARRLIARLTGSLTTGQTVRAVAPQEFADLPMFTTVDDDAPVADDADLDAQLAGSFGTEVPGDE